MYTPEQYEKIAAMLRQAAQMMREQDAGQQAPSVEPVGEVVEATGTLKDMHVIRWRDGFMPEVGTKLYTAPPLSVPDRTIYDHRVAIDNAAREAGPQLYVALKNLLDAVEERHYQAGIDSVTIYEAHRALVAAAPKVTP